MRDISLIVQIVLVVASCVELQWMYACKFSFAFRSRVSCLASKLPFGECPCAWFEVNRLHDVN